VGEEVPASTDVVNPDGPEPLDPAPSPAGTGEGRTLMRQTGVMSVGTALSRATGFLRVIATAYALGVGLSRLADAYNVANTTPNIVYDLVLGGILSSVFVPVFVEWRETRGEEAALRSAQAIMTFTALLLAAVAMLTIVFAGAIIHAYTFQDHGANRDAYRQLAVFFLRWFMPQVLFYGLGAVATGLLNAHRRFAVPMFAPILNNLIVIATMLVFASITGHAAPTESSLTEVQRSILAIGTTLGVVVMTIALWPSLRRTGFRWRWRLDLRDEAFRRIGKLAGWMLVYVASNQLGYLVVIVLANRVQGGYTAFSYAYIFFQLPHAIFAVSVFTALLPALASHWTRRDTDRYRLLLSRGIRLTGLIVLPAAAGYIALGGPIARVLLQHGQTTQADAAEVGRILVLFAVGLLPFSLFQLLLRGFYAMQDTRTPALINLAATLINTAVNLIYFRYFGVKGLALGQTTAYTFATIAAALVIRSRLGGLDGRRLARSFAEIAAAALATGLAAFAAAQVVSRAVGSESLGSQAAQLAAGTAAGVFVFAAAASLLRIGEVAFLKDLIRRRVT
jgi:putative peptidoglycan lipid II flippase